MAEKLKSITKRIPWSLPLRSGAAAIAFLALPFWVFLAVAAYVYFVPWFRARLLVREFTLTMVIAAMLPSTAWSTIAIFAVFALMLGVKDLIIVERGRGYELLAILLSFLIVTAVFHVPASESWKSAGPFLLMGLAGVAIGLLLARMPFESEKGTLGIEAAVAGFLIAEAGAVLLFLPIGFFYQTVVLFSLAAALLILLPAYREGKAGRSLLLASFGFAGAVVLAVMILTDWQL